MLFVVSAQTYPLIRLPFRESPIGGAHQAEGPFLKPRCLGDRDMLDTVVLPQGGSCSSTGTFHLRWPPAHQGV